ncbi:MAG: NYN domain-containing protein, partial [Candidatus Geothermincolia bacterium]
MQLLLVDGYNVIHADAALERLINHELELAREGLLARLRPLSDLGRYRVVVVFDGAGNRAQSPTLEKWGGIEIAFSAAGQSADSLLERLARRLRDMGREVTLATDDRQEQAIARNFGCGIKASAALLAEADEAAEGIRQEVVASESGAA